MRKKQFDVPKIPSEGFFFPLWVPQGASCQRSVAGVHTPLKLESLAWSVNFPRMRTAPLMSTPITHPAGSAHHTIITVNAVFVIKDIMDGPARISAKGRGGGHSTVCHSSFWPPNSSGKAFTPQTLLVVPGGHHALTFKRQCSPMLARTPIRLLHGLGVREGWERAVSKEKSRAQTGTPKTKPDFQSVNECLCSMPFFTKKRIFSPSITALP